MDERKILAEMGLTTHDIEKHLKNGAMICEAHEFMCEYDDEEFEDLIGITRIEYAERIAKATKSVVNFLADTDLCVMDDKKYIIEYVL